MKGLLAIAMLAFTITTFGQDVNTLLKEGANLERSLKEEEAIEKYKQVINVDANNITAFLRASELNSFVGVRQEDKKQKKAYFEAARSFAEKAIATDPNNADANYVMSLSSWGMTQVETDNKKLVAFIKDMKTFADKALAINPNHARANYMEGKWHFDMLQMSWVKRLAAKTLFGGMPEAKMEEAVKYMERCRQLDQYYMANYLDLAKAYKFDNKPSQAIEILQKLVKLPIRTANDAAFKTEGKKLLEEML